MLTNQDAKHLLDLEKILIDPNQIIDLSKKKNRLDLISHQGSKHEFWVKITTNQQIILETSIHHLQSNSYVGPLRIDYKGGPYNTVNITNFT